MPKKIEIRQSILKRRTRYDIYIDIDSANKLEIICEMDAKSKSELMEQIINEYFKSRESEVNEFLRGDYDSKN